jgi:hypothetical protein
MLIGRSNALPNTRRYGGKATLDVGLAIVMGDLDRDDTFFFVDPEMVDHLIGVVVARPYPQLGISVTLQSTALNCL